MPISCVDSQHNLSRIIHVTSAQEIWPNENMKRGADYLCTKLGDVVTAIEQVAVVKGLAMWEVERKISAGIKKRLIVSERTLISLQMMPTGA